MNGRQAPLCLFHDHGCAAPHNGFSTLIRRINARRSPAIFGRPPRKPDFQRQYRRKPAQFQRTRSLRSDDRDGLHDRWEPFDTAELGTNDPVREVDTTAHLPPLHDQLSRSAAFSASSRLVDLNSEASRVRNKEDEVFGTHTPSSSW
jgi:hypothetical protein